MKYAILDCYTDEASGLGVPPYLGTYPRYIAGYLDESCYYLTIDDVRLWRKHNSKIKETKPSQKTDITTYNLTINYQNIEKILHSVETLIVVLGVHVPGKYLSAIPGTLKEIIPYIRDLPCKKILTGPAVFGTQLIGGQMREQEDLSIFDKVDRKLYDFKFSSVTPFAIRGSHLLKQIPDLRMIEIETGHGCDIGHCSFCTEPIKNKVEFREMDDVLKEIKAFYNVGARYFRLGKQTCFYTTPYAKDVLPRIWQQCPDIKVLHIDNCNPVKVLQDSDRSITKAIVQYCTSGNIAAFGVESFDIDVVRKNTLNTIPKVAYEAIKIINEFGSERGSDGLPKFLPGINIIFGLMDETRKTHTENMKWLSKIYDDGLMLRRINIRQAAIFEGTPLFEMAGKKFLLKNKKYYWKWRNEIRQKIDFPMLKRVAPTGTVFKGCFAEIYDGKTTFCRQFGTYPLIVGVKGRLPLKKFYDLRITKQMLRSLTGEVVSGEPHTQHMAI